MRVRKTDPLTGDMMFGRSQHDYWHDQREGVGQLVGTRLALWLGQWFLNVDEGMPWATKVLGKYTEDFRDATIQARIVTTLGVTQLVGYNSQLERQTRDFTVHADIDTLYGQFQFTGHA